MLVVFSRWCDHACFLTDFPFCCICFAFLAVAMVTPMTVHKYAWEWSNLEDNWRSVFQWHVEFPGRLFLFWELCGGRRGKSSTWGLAGMEEHLPAELLRKTDGGSSNPGEFLGARKAWRNWQVNPPQSSWELCVPKPYQNYMKTTPKTLEKTHHNHTPSGKTISKPFLKRIWLPRGFSCCTISRIRFWDFNALRFCFV